jgi:hypothetical protein
MTENVFTLGSLFVSTSYRKEEGDAADVDSVVDGDSVVDDNTDGLAMNIDSAADDSVRGCRKSIDCWRLHCATAMSDSKIKRLTVSVSSPCSKARNI